MDEDRELLRRYASDRDEAAFAELVKRRLSLVYHAALRRVNGDTMLAEEVAQSVFVMLARNARALAGHAVLGGWLYVTTRQAAANALRQQRRRQRREQEAGTMYELNASEPDVMWAQLRPELDAVMDELADTDRDAVLLRFFESRPYAEIGSILRVSEDAARMRVDRALDKLRLAFGRRHIASTAAALGAALAAQSAVAAPAGLAPVVTSAAIAAAAVPASVGLIAFMSTNKIIAAVTGTLVLAAGGTIVFEQQAARRANEAVAALGREQAAVRAQLTQERDRANAADEARLAAERKAAELATQLAALGKTTRPAAVAVASPGRTAPVVTTFPDKMDVLYASPEYLQLQLRHTAAALPLQYGTLYASLQWPAEKIAQFEALMIERQQAMFDTFAAARAQGVSISDPLLAKLPDADQGVIEAKLKALLGESDYQSFRDYARSSNSSARTAVGSLASNLYYTGAPLTAAQGSQLAQLIATHTAPPSKVGRMQMTPEPDWPAIYMAAAPILSARQIAVLRASNDRLRLGREISELSDKLLQEAVVAGKASGGG